MSGTSKQQPVAETPKRGEAAGRAARDAVAKRNEQARKLGRARREKQYAEHAAERRAADVRERAEITGSRP